MYQLRPSDEDDFEFLYDLHRQAMHDYVQSLWGWDEEDQIQRFRTYFDSNPLDVIMVNGAKVGMLHVKHSGEELEIVNIEIAPEHQGQGIGSMVLEDLLKRSKSAKLQVLKVNLGAARLYKRLGFITHAESETHYLMSLDH
jgi:ribosomal protein S18 acetylase RimI-like enzyme